MSIDHDKDMKKKEFEDLEQMLRKSMAREKMPGLLPDQLRSLHEKIDGATANPIRLSNAMTQAMPSEKSSKSGWSFWRWILVASPGIAVAFLALNLFQNTDQAKMANLNEMAPAPKDEAEVHVPEGKSDRVAANHAEKKSASSGAKAPAKAKQQLDVGGHKDAGVSAGVSASSSVSDGTGARAEVAESSQMGALAPSVYADDAPSVGGGAKTMRAAEAARPAAKAESPAAIASRQAPGSSNLRPRPGLQAATVVIVKDSVKTTQGGASAVIYTAIQKQIYFARHCYVMGLQQTPSLAGDLRMALTLNPSGKVSGVELKSWTLGNQKTIDCVRESVGRWQFSKSAGTGFEVTLRFTP